LVASDLKEIVLKFAQMDISPKTELVFLAYHLVLSVLIEKLAQNVLLTSLLLMENVLINALINKQIKVVSVYLVLTNTAQNVAQEMLLHALSVIPDSIDIKVNA
jgi:hypothetical protein